MDKMRKEQRKTNTNGYTKTVEEKIDFQKALEHKSQSSENNKKAIISHYLYSKKDVAELYKQLNCTNNKQ